MSAVEAARNKKHRAAEADRISNLPPDITQNILGRLSILEAVRTSILSKYWRYEWTNTPNLILDAPFFNEISSLRNNKICLLRNKADVLGPYLNAVNNILLSHTGPIHKVELYIPNWNPRETNIWIRNVCANNVKELNLEYAWGLQKNIPSCLFSCSSLTHLSVLGCTLLRPLPPTFTGFPCLVSLKLGTCWSTETCIDTNVLESFISKCPQLESLFIVVSEPSASLTIHAAPKLKMLFVGGMLHKVCISGTAVINKLTLAVDLHVRANVIDFFSSLTPKVETLVLNGMWGAINDYVYPQKFTKELDQLRTLKLVEMPLYRLSCISFAISVILSSPHLERLHIQAEKHGPPEVIEDQPVQFDNSCTLERLRKIRLLGISGFGIELELVKFLLARSSVLEKMVIKFRAKVGAAEACNFIKETIHFHRSYPNANIIFSRDLSFVPFGFL